MYDNQNDIPMASAAANQVDSPSPKRMTASRRTRVKNAESPTTTSPLKQPRQPASYQGYSSSYQPPSRQEILGKPIEIIPGKFISRASLTYAVSNHFFS